LHTTDDNKTTDEYIECSKIHYIFILYDLIYY
jgi:hypothetical protein